MKGFTLLELLIVITLLVLCSVIFGPKGLLFAFILMLIVAYSAMRKSRKGKNETFNSD